VGRFSAKIIRPAALCLVDSPLHRHHTWSGGGSRLAVLAARVAVSVSYEKLA